ncbi:MAG: hypothetical protein COT18_06095 [Elusimicrobia bacterium CG08_land_8_20_14_0_20_59_10]|nr:MAG: hypothetical protein COT18_06095 [Elusimicrobia bacterium CG08_land_8_20_14_0_20_59_10]
MKKLFSLPLLIFFFTGLQAAATTIVVYHTSDIHGWYSARPALWDNRHPDRLMGGFAALSALLRKETTPYLLLDSGDMFQGTPEGILTKGLASIALMNQLGYSAAVPGNHDYDYGEPNLKVLISSAAFPFLGANVYYKAGGAHADYLKPYVIVEKAGKRIALLGLAGRHTATSTLPINVNHLDFRDEAAEAARWTAGIKKRAPDAIIALAHLGLSEDLSLKYVDISTWTFEPAPPGTLRLARAAKDIDLVLGGHQHFGLTRGYHDPVSGTWLGESYYGLSYVTRAELNFDDGTGALSGINVSLVPLWPDETGLDLLVQRTISGFSAAVEREMGTLAGSAAEDLLFSREGLDSAIGNWLADAVRKAAGTDVAFQNTAGIRAGLRKGEIRLRDVYQAMPFENTIVTMRLNGARLKQLMAGNIRGGETAMQISGLEVEFRPVAGAAPAEICLKRGGREIKAEDEFTVATNNYLAFGGDGGAVFSGGKDIKDTMVSLRDVMLKCLAAGPVKNPGTGRIKLLK